MESINEYIQGVVLLLWRFFLQGTDATYKNGKLLLVCMLSQIYVAGKTVHQQVQAGGEIYGCNPRGCAITRLRTSMQKKL